MSEKIYKAMKKYRSTEYCSWNRDSGDRIASGILLIVSEQIF